MPTPSLLIVPSRWKAGSPGKLYSQIPTNGNGDFNVTGVVTGGTSIGTRVNNIGYIEPITTSGTPRLDYYTSSGVPGCPALLVEPAATNLAFHSTDWTSNWGNTAITVVTGTTATTDPFGTNLANAISPTSGNTAHIAQSNNPTTTTYTSGTVYTQSAFFKQGTGVAGRYVQLTFPGPIFSQLGYANFDLQLGTLAVVSGTSADTNRAASIENYGNGWYRCRLTATCTLSATAVGFTSALATASGALRVASFSGTVTDVIYGVGAQVETGSVATSYIPTTTAAVTRNADVVLVSGAVSGSIGQTQGTIYAEVDVKANKQSVRALQISNGTINNRIQLAYNGNDFTPAVVSGGVVQASFTVPFVAGLNKIAIAYANNDVVAYQNGVLVGTNTSASIPPCNQIEIGSSIGTSAFFNDRIRAAALYTTRLSNADLMLLTLPGNNTYLPQAIWDNYLSRTGNSEVPDCLYTRHADLLDV